MLMYYLLYLASIQLVFKINVKFTRGIYRYEKNKNNLFAFIGSVKQKRKES